MPPATRITDLGSGHGSFIPSVTIEGSENVITCSQPQSRVRDAIQAHPSSSPSPPHGRKYAAGSTTVYTNSRQTIRIGDPIDCGGSAMQGCGTVLIGG